MDKNQLTGMILMGAIIFGFLYLMKPSERQMPESTEWEQTTAPVSQSQSATFNSGDSAALVSAINILGTIQENGSRIFKTSTLNLVVDSVGQLSGSATLGNESVDIRALISGRESLITPLATKAAAEVRDIIDKANKYSGFARHLGGENKETILENDLVKVTLSSQGARVSQVELKKYKTEVGGNPTNIRIFTHETDNYSFSFNTFDQRINTRDFNFETISEGDSAVLFAMHPTVNSTWGIRYKLSPNDYVVTMEVIQQGLSGILPASTATMDFNWHQKLGRNELGRTFEERNSAIYYKFIGEGPDNLKESGDDSKSLSGRLRWIAFKNQFFSSIIIARNQFSSANLKSVDIKDNDYLKDMDMEASLPYTTADGVAAAFDFYFGPNDYPILSKLDDRLDLGEDLDLTRLIPLGWGLFRWINTLIIIPVFTFLSSFISNYGIIILLLTIFIKIIIFPFTFKSFKSQAKMRVLAPEIKEINEKYPKQEDALKRQQETMALYSRAGASPFSGCLPMLLQMPVLIAMFSFFPSAIELRGQSFLWAHDLSAPDSILTLPFSIPFYGNHVSLFCLLMTAVNIVYMHFSMQSQPGGASMPGMKMMQYFMPIMFLFIFNDYASGLSYYYFLSLLITILQTLIFRKVIDEDKVRQQLLANAKKPRKKSGWMAKLEEAQRQAEAAQRQQAKKRR